jgi:hypothetical protein
METPFNGSERLLALDGAARDAALSPMSSSSRRSRSSTSRRRVHLGEHELDGSISPLVAQGFGAAMHDESARGEQYRPVLPSEFSDRFPRVFEGTWSTA